MICEHFGEPVKRGRCAVCDVCAGQPQWMQTAAEAKSRAGRAAGIGYSLPAVVRNAHVGRGAIGPARYSEPVMFAATPAAPVDDEMREFLREWRRNTARQRGIAVFVVLHDTTLDDLCVRQPKTLRELREISGMGEKKCELYGQEILEALERFRQGERASQEWHARPSNPSQETLELLLKGHSFQEIAQIRGRKVSSVVALVADLVERGATRFQDAWVEAEKREQICEAAEHKGLDLLKPIKDSLPEHITYEEIRLVVAELRRERRAQDPPSKSEGTAPQLSC